MPKGVYIRTDCHRKILSIAKKGKKISSEGCKNISKGHMGINTWMKGRHLSEETKRKISEAQRGAKHYNWKGGITSESIKRIQTPEWKEIRKKIYKRDNYRCQICGVQYKDKNNNGMNIHHIIPYNSSRDNSMNNLITLCDSCHIKEEKSTAELGAVIYRLWEMTDKKQDFEVFYRVKMDKIIEWVKKKLN